MANAPNKGFLIVLGSRPISVQASIEASDDTNSLHAYCSLLGSAEKVDSSLLMQHFVWLLQVYPEDALDVIKVWIGKPWAGIID